MAHTIMTKKTGMDEVIKLNFADYWGNKITNTEMTVAMIVGAQRFGVKISALPDWVQEKIHAAKQEEEAEQEVWKWPLD